MRSRRPKVISGRQVEELLQPGVGKVMYESLRSGTTPGAADRSRRYVLLSSISSAIRERAEDQNRSTDRSDVSSASAVSAVVKPAK